MIYKLKIDSNDMYNLKAEDFEFTEYSKIYGRGFYKRSNVAELTKSLKFSKPDKTQLKDKSFYRYPNLSLPRDKMSLLKDSLNIKITRKIDKADYVILPENFIDSILTTEFMLVVDIAKLKSIIVNANTISKQEKEKILEKLSAINLKHDYEVFFITEIFNSNETSLTKNIRHRKVSRSFIILKDEAKKLLENAASLNNVVSDTYMNEICSSELHAFTPESIETIIEMVETQKVTDVSMALEIMSNCNIEKSFPFLVYVFGYYYNVLKDFSTNWNSINVKTLRKALGSYACVAREYNLMSYNYFLVDVAKDGYLTQWLYEKIRERAFNDVIHKFGFNHGLFQIDINDIKLADEYKNKIVEI